MQQQKYQNTVQWCKVLLYPGCLAWLPHFVPAQCEVFCCEVRSCTRGYCSTELTRVPFLFLLQEAVESCLTRVTKLELQQQQQQVVQLEGVENANARALLGKFINVILALMAVLLVFVSTIASFITPLMKTRMRLLSTTLLVLFLFLLWKHWDSITYLLEHVLLPSWFPCQGIWGTCGGKAKMRTLPIHFLCYFGICNPHLLPLHSHHHSPPTSSPHQGVSFQGEASLWDTFCKGLQEGKCSACDIFAFLLKQAQQWKWQALYADQDGIL